MIICLCCIGGEKKGKRNDMDMNKDRGTLRLREMPSSKCTLSREVIHNPIEVTALFFAWITQLHNSNFTSNFFHTFTVVIIIMCFGSR